MNNICRSAILCFLSLTCGVSVCRGQIVLMNGDFELPGTNIDAGNFPQGIPNWGESNVNSGFPNYADFLIVGVPHAALNNGQTAGINSSVGGYIYQEIGTTLGDPILRVAGVNYHRNQGIPTQHASLNVSVYSLPAGDPFAFAEVGNDIAGAAGVNLVGTQVVADPVVPGSTVPFTFDFDTSGLAANDRIFLRFSSAVGNFAYVDDVTAITAVPEPSTVGLVAFTILGGFAYRWRKKRNAAADPTA